jgi:hypothetical protein
MQEELSIATEDHTTGPSDAGGIFSSSRILMMRKLWPISVIY